MDTIKMKRISILTLVLMSTVMGMAQKTPVEKYEIAPCGFEEVYLDGIQKYPSKIIDTTNGQYVGQVDPEDYLYGYGMFLGNDGTQITGKFRQGQLLFGITVAQQNAIVGSPTYYASYSLQTGRLEYIFRNNQKFALEGESLGDYAFVTMKYLNGDQYVGEVYKGKRHGFGIYYYADGDFWFGEYNNGVRVGYGALYTVGDGMFIGEWCGEDVKRIISVKRK